MAPGAIKLAALAGLASKARDYARKNPDSVSSTISKFESTVGRKVGPKYAAHVGKGGAAVRSGLGLPAGSPSASTSPVDPDPRGAEPKPGHGIEDQAPPIPGERPHH